MPKVAVLGANGQVGAEVCLLLRQQAGVEVVPICRNRHGSSFLRSQGLRCRHGLVTDAQQAADLVGDCDVVANFALGAGRPGEARRQNTLLIENSTRFAPANAKVIYFSTMSVYGDPSPNVWIRWRSSYGREKLRCETWQRRVASREGRTAYILRLGHVCGELQNISQSIRDQIAAGPVVLAGEGSGASNTVHVATIVDAILKIAAGGAPAGTYDLMNRPQWSWREVYEYEAREHGLSLEIEKGAPPPAPISIGKGIIGGVTNPPKRLAGALLARPGVRELVLRSMAHLPGAWNEKLQATYYKRRAAADITALKRKEHSRESFIWVAMGRQFMSSLTPTVELLKQPAFRLSADSGQAAFPVDLPLAGMKGG